MSSHSHHSLSDICSYQEIGWGQTGVDVVLRFLDVLCPCAITQRLANIELQQMSSGIQPKSHRPLTCSSQASSWRIIVHHHNVGDAGQLRIQCVDPVRYIELPHPLSYFACNGLPGEKRAPVLFSHFSCSRGSCPSNCRETQEMQTGVCPRMLCRELLVNVAIVHLTSWAPSFETIRMAHVDKVTCTVNLEAITTARLTTPANDEQEKLLRRVRN